MPHMIPIPTFFVLLKSLRKNTAIARKDPTIMCVILEMVCAAPYEIGRTA